MILNTKAKVMFGAAAALLCLLFPPILLLVLGGCALYLIRPDLFRKGSAK
jgi:hypothetical protein